MRRVTITIDLPEGVEVHVHTSEDASGPRVDPVDDYWEGFLSENGRRLYGAAARFEDVHGAGYSLEDLARNIGLDYESVKSFHRNAGRTALRWSRERGTAAPVRLEVTDYGPQEGVSGLRTRYELPPGVATKILAQLSYDSS